VLLITNCLKISKKCQQYGYNSGVRPLGALVDVCSLIGGTIKAEPDNLVHQYIPNRFHSRHLIKKPIHTEISTI
jgi:hypothetical protein